MSSITTERVEMLMRRSTESCHKIFVPFHFESFFFSGFLLLLLLSIRSDGSQQEEEKELSLSSRVAHQQHQQQRRRRARACRHRRQQQDWQHDQEGPQSPEGLSPFPKNQNVFYFILVH